MVSRMNGRVGIMTEPYTIHTGDCLEVLAGLPDESVQTCITSPPYWGLRDYGVPGQLGLEPTPEAYTASMVEIFREVRRVLRDDGTLWLNLGDTYNAYNHNRGPSFKGANKNHHDLMPTADRQGLNAPGLKPKDLVGIPWRIAFALQADGWYLRSDIIWSKPNPMPESISDRPTKAHEYIFLLTKRQRYYYDLEAIKEPVTGNAHGRGAGVNPKAKVPSGWDTGPGDHRGRRGRYPKSKQNASFSASVVDIVDERNKRSVWAVPTQPYPEAHFATYPEALILPCVLAGAAAGAIVFDPFTGSGTTAVVALKQGRRFVGIELNPEYVQMAERRIRGAVGELALMMMERGEDVCQ